MNPATSKSIFPSWFKLIFIGLAALLLLLLIAIFTVITVLRNSPAQLEIVLEEVASRILKRELQIGELLEAELGWDTYLLARDVSLANPDWTETPDFVRVGRLLIRINLPSIWRDGPILISELELADAYVVLLAPEDQAPNWDFWPGEDEQEAQDDEVDAGNISKPVFPVLFSAGHMINGEIVYRDPDQDVVISIKELKIQDPHEGALINLDLTGIINDIPLQANGRIGPAAALVSKRELKLDLDVKLGLLSIEGRGTIDDLANFSGPDLHLKISAPRSRPLLDILGMPEVRDGPLRFEGHITDAHPGLAIDAVGSLDEFHLQISGTVTDPMAVDGVDIAFKLDGPSLAEVGAIFDLQGLPAQPYEASGEIRRLGTDLTLSNGVFAAGEGRLTIEGRLPDFPGIDDWELDLASDSFNLEMLGSLVGAEDLPAIPYDIKGTLASTDEGVELVDLRIRSPEISLLLNGVVGEAPDYLGSRIEIELRGKDMAYAGLWLGLHDIPGLEYQVSGELLFSDLGWRLSDGIFTTQGLRLVVNAEVDKLPDPTTMAVTLRLDSENFAESVTLFGFASEGLPALPLSVNGRLSGSPEKVMIDEITADLGKSHVRVSGILGDPVTLSTLDLTVDFTTPDLLKLFPETEDDALPQLSVDTSSHIAMSADGIAIEEFQGKFAGATIALKGHYYIKPFHDNSHFTLRADGPDLSKVLGPWLEQDIPNIPFQLSLEAHFKSGGVQVERLEVLAANAQLSAQFDIDNLEELTGAQGKIKFSGASSLELAQVLGLEAVIPDADYVLNVDIQRSPDSLRLNPLTLDWGASDYSGSVAIKWGDVPNIHADLHSKFVSLPFLLPDTKELQNEEDARVKAGDSADASMATATLSKKELAERVIPDDTLDFSWLRKLQASIKYRVDEVYISDEAKSSAVIDLSIADGVLSSKQLSLDGTLISGDAELTIRALEQGAEINSHLEFRRLPLILLLGGQPRHDPDTFYRAQIRTAGSSYREMAKSANGALVFSGGGGRLDNKGLDLIMGDALEEIFDRLNPFSETDPDTKIICHAGAMTIESGKVSVAPGLVVRTDKIDIASGGRINLHNEELDLAFNTRSRKGIGISASKAMAPYFKIGGTMANPRLALDVKGAAVSGGAAFATAGLSILAEGLWDRWVATAKNPCEGLITQISKEDKNAYKALLAAPGRPP